jgi:hypothetical protein
VSILPSDVATVVAAAWDVSFFSAPDFDFDSETVWFAAAPAAPAALAVDVAEEREEDVVLGSFVKT